MKLVISKAKHGHIYNRSNAPAMGYDKFFGRIGGSFGRLIGDMSLIDRCIGRQKQSFKALMIADVLAKFTFKVRPV